MSKKSEQESRHRATEATRRRRLQHGFAMLKDALNLNGSRWERVDILEAAVSALEAMPASQRAAASKQHKVEKAKEEAAERMPRNGQHAHDATAAATATATGCQAISTSPLLTELELLPPPPAPDIGSHALGSGGVFLLSPSLHFLDVSESLLALAGVSRDSTLGNSILTHTRDLPKAEEFASALRGLSEGRISQLMVFGIMATVAGPKFSRTNFARLPCNLSGAVATNGSDFVIYAVTCPCRESSSLQPVIICS